MAGRAARVATGRVVELKVGKRSPDAMGAAGLAAGGTVVAAEVTAGYAVVPKEARAAAVAAEARAAAVAAGG